MERRSPSCLSLMPRSEPHLPAAPQLLGLPLEPLLQGLGPQAIGVPGVQPFLAHPESASPEPSLLPPHASALCSHVVWRKCSLCAVWTLHPVGKRFSKLFLLKQETRSTAPWDGDSPASGALSPSFAGWILRWFWEGRQGRWGHPGGVQVGRLRPFCFLQVIPPGAFPPTPSLWLLGENSKNQAYSPTDQQVQAHWPLGVLVMPSLPGHEPRGRDTWASLGDRRTPLPDR